MRAAKKRGSLRRAKLAVPLLSLTFLLTFLASATRTGRVTRILDFHPLPPSVKYTPGGHPHLPQIISIMIITIIVIILIRLW